MLAAGIARSQPAAGPVWSLQRCLEHARTSNLALKQAELRMSSAQSNLEQARDGRLPNLNGGASAFSRSGFFVDPFTNTLKQQSVLTSDVNLSTGVDLYAGGRITNTIRRNELGLAVSRADLDQQENDLALNIALAYLQILQNAELLESARLQVASTKEQRERTRKLVEAGSAAPADLLQVDAQISTEELNVVTAQNQLEMAYLSLQQLLNLDISEPFTIERVDLPDPEGEFMASPLADMYKSAENTQPFIRSADLSVQAAEVDVQLAKGAYYPTLSFGAGVGSGYSSGRRGQTGEFTELPGNPIPVQINDQPATLEIPQLIPVTAPISYFEQIGENISASLSLRLNVPIYNRRQAKTSLELAQIGQQNAVYAAEIQRQNLKQTIQQAYVDARGAYSSYLATRRQTEAASLNFQNIDRQFNVGLVNSLDYLVAKNNLNRARFDLVRAKYTYIFRLKVLDFYQGKPIGF